jgi:hypothetical protein
LFEIIIGNLRMNFSDKEAVGKIEEVSKVGELSSYLTRLVEQDVSGLRSDAKLDQLLGLVGTILERGPVASRSVEVNTPTRSMGPVVVEGQESTVVEDVKPKGSAVDVLRRMKEINKKGGA